MLHLSKTELAMEKMLRAAYALEVYFRNGAPDYGKYKQLAKAAKVASDEFAEELAAQCHPHC